MSRLLQMLGCRYPILQGPIAELNSPRMVAAMSEAGAYGMLALGFADGATARKLVKEVGALTEKPFGANLMLINPACMEILDILAGAGVRTVTTSVGSPKEVYKKIHELGMKGLHVALSLTHAMRAEEAGADGLVISGAESGGLRSKDPELMNMVLIPLVTDHVRIPVVAAGGIADGRGLRAALALGAQGVQVGTRLIASAESPANEKWKQAIVDCGDAGTALLPLKRMNMRVIVSPRLREEMKDPAIDLSARYDLSDVPRAWGPGDFDLFPAGAGPVSALIREIKPVKAIIDEMASGLK